jgi:hypothetical protein
MNTENDNAGQHEQQQIPEQSSNGENDQNSVSDAGLQPSKRPLPEHLKKHCFKPGVSGNPTGRPRGTVSLKATIRRRFTARDAIKTADNLRSLAGEAKNSCGVAAAKAIMSVTDPDETSWSGGLSVHGENARVQIIIAGNERRADLEGNPAPISGPTVIEAGTFQAPPGLSDVAPAVPTPPVEPDALPPVKP